ncbi:MAG: T9SS type A sorting domain-containing protein, partial [Roseivirga sp.]|nr:T9SS type A sorting domain-containing protein [Roseivirga sp.]
RTAGSGGVSPFTYSWHNGATTATTSGLHAITFTITVTDANGATATNQTTVTEPAALGAASVTDQNVSINGGSDGGATASATGGTAPYTYSWNNGATVASITGQPAGTYTVSVTDNNGCGPATSQVTITEPAVLTAATIVDFNVNCNGGSDGGATASATGGTQPYTYSWNNGATNASITNTTAGTYTVTITDNNGATSTSSTTITEPAALATSIAGSTIDDGFGNVFDETISCNGFTDGGLTASATGGTGPYTYLWSVGSPHASIVGIGAGTYTVTVTDNNGCTTTAQGTVTEPDALVAASVTDQNVSINGGSDGGATASATGGTAPYTYSWNNGATVASITGQPAGTYTVSVTDNNGCGPATSQVTITEPAVLTAATIVDFNVNCNGGSDGGATASATGGTQPYTYTWSNGATNASITNSVAGTYTVTVTDNNGATSISSSTITEPLNLAASLVTRSNVSVNGGSDGEVEASGGGGTRPFTYLWSTGNTQTFDDNLTAGTYTVTITDANGCTASSFAIVTEPSALVVNTQVTDVSCNSGADGSATANPTGGTSPYTYLWSNGSTNATISGGAAGTYTVTVTDNNGGTASKSAMINEPSALGAGSAIDQNVSIHGGSDGGATASATGGTAPYTYSWNNGATVASITGQPAGTYTVSVTDNNGCGPATSQVTITEPINTDPTFTSSPVTTVFDNESYSYTITTSDGDGDQVVVSASTLPAWLSLRNNFDEAIASTLAGSVSGSAGSADGMGTNATFNRPYDVEVDRQGNIYVAEFDGKLIRKVTPEGVVSVFAGSGSGSAIVDGSGTGAVFVQPTGLTIDQSDNLYVGDGSFLRKITPAGVVTTLMGDGNSGSFGSSGTAYDFTQVFVDIVIDDTGNIYATRTILQNIIRIDAAGAVTDFVGGFLPGTADGTGTDAQFFGPGGLTLDETGNLFISDVQNNLIRKATPAGVVSTFAGSGTSGLANGTGTNAEFTGPSLLDVDNEGNLLVAESNLGRIRIINPEGVVSTLVGGGSGSIPSLGYLDGTGTDAAFTNPTSLTVDHLGNIYVAEYGGNRIRKVVRPILSTSLIGDPTGQVGNHNVVLDATDGNEGSVEQSFTVMVNASLSLATQIDSQVSCNGGSDGGVTAVPSGGSTPYTYSWSNGATNASITGVTAGAYSITVTDANGATATSSSTVTEPVSLAASVAGSTIDDGFGNVFDETITCNGFTDGGLTASPTGGTGPYTYLWSVGATNASIVGIGAGTYTVTVTDNNGCTTTAQGTVTEPDALVTNASTDNNVSVHSGADGQISASPTGGSSPYTYLWSNGGTSAVESGLAAGTYTVTVTDNNGCTSSESTQVTEPSALVISTQITDVSCNSGADGAATANPTGGTSPYTYLWSNSSTNASITGEAAGTYTVTVTDNNGGTASKSAMINEPAAVVANATTDNNVSVHSGADGQISASPTGGTSPYTYLWSNGGTNATQGTLAAGTYTVTVTDNNGCTSSESTQVTEPSALVISTQITDVSCNSGADGAATANPTGGTSPYTYLWSNGSTNASITGEAAGTYTVTVTDNNGGTASKSAMINEPSAVVANASTDNNVSVHSGADGQISASPTGGTSPYTYQWSNGATNAIVNTLPAGTYTVTVTDNNGCTSSESTQVTEPSALVIGTQITDVSCNSGADGAVTANPTGGTSPYTYLWSTGATSTGISNLAAGTYTVTVTDNNGGTASKSAMINEPSALLANAVTDQNVTTNGGSDGQVSISPSGGTAPYTYNWGTGATTATVSGLPAGNYSVSVIDNNGCSAFSSTTVTEPANTNPVFNSDPVTSVNDNEHYAYRPRILDNEGDPVTISANDLPSWLSLGITPEGIVTTFAGSGASDDTNGTGTEATFSFPVGMTIDGVGNIYVAASGQIRVITPEGVVSTLQVNDGLGSTESYSDGADRMVFDAAGNLYVVVPAGSNKINKITPSGDVSVFAGGGSGTADGTGTDATFNNPRGITIDGAGNLYVTDERNDLIRKITPAGVVSTFAGTAGEFSFPYGITIDAAGNLYVVDTGNSKIKKVTPGGVVTTLAGAGNGSADGTGTAATFSYPTGIAIDNQGNLIIADQNNNKVRKITPAGVVTTLAGSGSEAVVDGTGTSASFAYLNDVAVDGLGNIFVSDLNGNVIRKIDASVQELSGDPTDQVGDHPVVLDASDGNGGTAQQSFIVTVADHTAPEITSSSAVNFAENGTGVAYTATATDTNSEAIISYNLGSGNDEALFGINGNEVSFSLPPDFESPIDNGDNNTYVIEVIAKDDANNESKQLVTITVTDVQEDITPPAKPVITGISDDTGSSATDGITSDRSLLIHGTAEALATVEVFAPAGKIGTTQADTNGDWTLDITAFNLQEMSANTTAEAIDAAQNRSAASDIFVITIDFTPPAKPVITGISDDTGSSNADGVTSDRNLLIHGTAEADAIVEVFSPGGKIGTTQADANGDWTLDITTFNLPEITSNTTAEALDLAGNRSPTSDGFVIEIDFTAPAKPVVTGISDDTGRSSSDGITSDRNLLIHGTAEPNATVEVFSSAGRIGETPADANGDWVLDITAFNLPQITSNTTAEAVDRAGNRSATSDAFVIQIDFTAPAKPVITGISDDTGRSSSDGITSDRTLLIHGTAEPNVTVEVFSSAGKIGEVTADANGDWTLDITAFNLPQITSNTTAEAIDLAGNRSATSDIFVITIDFTAPAKPVITSISDDTGSNSSDGVTSDRNILIHGTAEANANVDVFSPGGLIGNVPADANGDWTLDISRFNLPEFTAIMTAEAIDLAGNRSVTSDNFTLTIDFTSPGVTIDIANNMVAGYEVMAIFDEEVSGLTLAEITVANGTASALVQTNATTYSFLVNSTGNSADVTVDANAAEDLAGNGNTVSNQLTLGFTPVSAGEEFTDLPNLRKAEEISIYPNPASKVLTIDLSELSAEEVDIYMYDAAGAPVLTREGYKEKTLRVDVSNYTSGLYIVQFFDGTNVIRKKVIVKK